MLPSEAVAPRRAALLLHALPDVARAQVLAQLSDGQRDTVQVMLAELQALGIPQDRDWLSLVDQQGDGADALLHQVDRLQAADVVRALEGKSLPTIVAVLSVHDWTWHAGVMAALPSDQRIRVKGLLKDGVVLRNATAQALLGRLITAVRNQNPHSELTRSTLGQSAPAGSWLSRLFR